MATMAVVLVGDVCSAWRPPGAVRIFGATALMHAFPGIEGIDLQAAEDGIVAAARQALGDDEFAAAWAEGRSITLERATAEILHEENKHVRMEPGHVPN